METHLLGERVELYGRVLEVELLSRIREERTFSSLEALKEQIARDAAQAAAKQKVLIISKNGLLFRSVVLLF